MDIKEVEYFACLLDFYGELLTEKQREVLKMFFCENLGISEIAELCKTTRQAINDLLKRTEALLLDYENKLHIYEKFSKSKLLFDDDIKKIEQYRHIWEN